MLTKRVLMVMIGLGAAMTSSSTTEALQRATLASCTYSVSLPRGGETWRHGTSQTISWTKLGTCSNTIQLDLLRDGTQTQTIAPARPCAFEFTSPSDEDTWYTDQTYSVLWSSSGSCSSQVALHLLRAGEEVLTIDSRASNSGEKSWSVPSDLESGHDYTIRIRDTADDESQGFSESFSILDAAGPAFIYWLDNVARLAGAAGSVWRSDVVLLNPGDEDAMVELWLFTQDGAQVLESTVRNGTEGVFEDVVGLIGTTGKGCLGIGSSRPPQSRLGLCGCRGP